MMKNEDLKMTAPKMTKTAITIATMNSASELPMADVVKLIAKANGVSEAVAAGAYRWCVRKGVAKGTIPEKVAKVGAPKAPKTVKIGAIVKKATKAYVAKKAAELPSKSPDEIERIKAANLARMKEVMGKMKKLDAQVDAPKADADFDSFAAPAFLTKDELNEIL